MNFAESQSPVNT